MKIPRIFNCFKKPASYKLIEVERTSEGLVPNGNILGKDGGKVYYFTHLPRNEVSIGTELKCGIAGIHMILRDVSRDPSKLEKRLVGAAKRLDKMA